MATTEELAVRISARNDASRELRSVAADVDRVTVSTAAAGRSGIGLASAFGVINEHTRGMQSSVNTFVDRTALGLGALSVAGVGLGVRTAASFEQSRASFGALLGDVTAGDAVFAKARTYAINSSFDTSGVAAATQMLLASGSSATEALGLVKGLGDISALSIGDPNSNLVGMARQLAQIQSKNLLSSEDLQTLTENGFTKAWQVAAEVSGRGVAQLRRDMARGAQIPADGFLRAVETMQAKSLTSFRGGAEKMNATAAGQMANLQETFRVGLGTALEPALPAIIAELPTVSTALAHSLAEVAPELPKLVNAGLTLLPVVVDLTTGAADLASHLTPVAEGVGKVVNVLDDLSGRHAAEGLVATVVALRGFSAARGAARYVGELTTALRGLAVAEVAVNAVGGVDLPTGKRGKAPTSVARTGVRGVLETLGILGLRAAPAAAAAATEAVPAAFGALTVATPVLAGYYGHQVDKNNLVELGSAQDYARTTNALGQQTPDAPLAVYRERQVTYNNRFSGPGTGGDLLRPTASQTAPTHTTSFGDTHITVHNPTSTVDVQKGVTAGLVQYIEERNRRQ